MTTAPPPDPRLQGIDKIRDAARWLIVAFAAIGAAIAGTAPLSNIGKLGIHDWRLWFAAAAAAVAFIAIGAAIWAEVHVLEPVTTDLDELVQDGELRAVFADSFELLRGYGTNLDEFKAQYDAARGGYVDALAVERDNPSAAATAAAVAAQDAFFAFTPVVDRISTEGLLATVRRRFRAAQPVMFVGALLAALAIVAFEWAANPPDKKATPASGKLPNETIAASAQGGGVSVSPATARRLLRAHKISRSTAGSLVASFRGAIDVQTVQRGAVFNRYAATAKESGRFLTRSRFAGPRLARLALHLPFANTAACVQRVVARKRTLVLVGEIAQAEPKIEQFLVVDRDAFRFDTGKAYTRVPCPAEER